MGLLTEGSPLSWNETKALAEHVRQHGIEQFINLYSKLRDRTGDVLKWGDEVRLYIDYWRILYLKCVFTYIIIFY